MQLFYLALYGKHVPPVMYVESHRHFDTILSGLLKSSVSLFYSIFHIFIFKECKIIMGQETS